MLSELREWHATEALEADTYDELCDAAECLLLSRAGEEAEEPLARASTAVIGMLAVHELDEQNASWLLDSLLACGPRVALSEAA